MSQFLIYTFAENSTAITNHGSDGATYNGTANRNMYHMQANGYPYYGPFNGTADKIQIPSSTKNSYPANRTHAWEVAFYYNGHGVNGTYEKIWDKACGGLYLGTQMVSGVAHPILYAATTGNPAYWIFNGSFGAGHNYYLQVAINLGSTPSAVGAGSVHCHIGWDANTPQHFTPLLWQAGTGSWYNDAGSVADMANYGCGGGYNINGSFWIIREFDTAQNWDSYSDYSADLPRWSPNVDTSLSGAATNSTPPVGTVYQLYGTLQTAGGTKLAGKSLDLWYGYDNTNWTIAYGYATTDANGNYSHNETSVLGAKYFFLHFPAATGYNESWSPHILVTGQSISANAYPAVITTEGGPISPSSITMDATASPAVVSWEAAPSGMPIISATGDPITVVPSCISIEAAPLGLTYLLGINATVVGCECAPVLSEFPPANVYIDILGMSEYVFPVRIQLEAEARSMAVSQLSTQVLPPILEAELGTQNYCFVEVSEPAPATTAGAECGVLDPKVNIDNPTLLETDAILEEILEGEAQIADSIHIPITVAKDLELSLEVTTE